MDAAVAARVVERISHGTSIAERQQVFGVLVGLGADTQGGQIDTLLKLRRRFEILQKCDGVLGRLVGPQRLGLFHQRVDHSKLADARKRSLNINSIFILFQLQMNEKHRLNFT